MCNNVIIIHYDNELLLKQVQQHELTANSTLNQSQKNTKTSSTTRGKTIIYFSLDFVITDNQRLSSHAVTFPF